MFMSNATPLSLNVKIASVALVLERDNLAGGMKDVALEIRTVTFLPPLFLYPLVALIRLYHCMKTKNPFNFSYTIRSWKALSGTLEMYLRNGRENGGIEKNRDDPLLAVSTRQEADAQRELM